MSMINTETGASIGHYELIKKLGMGSAGEVYCARDRNLGRTVALKLLSDQSAEDVRARFIQEAKAASALNHPNILTVYEAGAYEKIDYIVMEYIEGQTLRERLKEGRLPLAQLLNISAQMCAALSVAHGAGIIHRDVKPDNVMIRKDGLVKLLDFGLAKIKDQQSAIKGGTKPGTLLGTVGYMSPEQVEGEAADARADIFALGSMIYEMVSGQPPFRADNPIDTMYAIMKLEPPPIPAEFEVPERLLEIITKALAKDPAARYQTAPEMAMELRQLNKRVELERVLQQSTEAPAAAEPAAQPDAAAMLSQTLNADLLLARNPAPANPRLPWILVAILTVIVIIETCIILFR
jgi:eukaryotic-like serine/threonine-protein kinase